MKLYTNSVGGGYVKRYVLIVFMLIVAISLVGCLGPSHKESAGSGNDNATVSQTATIPSEVPIDKVSDTRAVADVISLPSDEQKALYVVLNALDGKVSLIRASFYEHKSDYRIYVSGGFSPSLDSALKRAFTLLGCEDEEISIDEDHTGYCVRDEIMASVSGDDGMVKVVVMRKYDEGAPTHFGIDLSSYIPKKWDVIKKMFYVLGAAPTQIAGYGEAYMTVKFTDKVEITLNAVLPKNNDLSERISAFKKAFGGKGTCIGDHCALEGTYKGIYFHVIGEKRSLIVNMRFLP